jgi:peptidoglycan hydrolase CwlO-like protein
METAILSIGLASLVILDISFLVYRRVIRADKLFIAEAARDSYKMSNHEYQDQIEALEDEIKLYCIQIQDQQEEINKQGKLIEFNNKRSK